MSWRSLVVVIVVAVVASPQTVRAQDYTQVNIYQAPPMYSYAWNDPTLLTGIGIGIHIGGGVSGFVSDGARNTVDSDLGGMWTARATIGTHIPLGLDLAYVGSAVGITPLGDDGSLIGHAAEGALRWNVLPHYTWNPYLFVGIGWQRYDTSNIEVDLADADVLDEDEVATVPVGLGFVYRNRSGMVFDVRGTYRIAGESELLQGPLGEDADLDTWEASATLGYEL